MTVVNDKLLLFGNENEKRLAYIENLYIIHNIDHHYLHIKKYLNLMTVSKAVLLSRFHYFSMNDISAQVCHRLLEIT